MDDNIQKIGNKLLIRSLMAIHAPGLMASSSFKLAKVRIGNVPMTFVPQKTWELKVHQSNNTWWIFLKLWHQMKNLLTFALFPSLYPNNNSFNILFYFLILNSYQQ